MSRTTNVRILSAVIICTIAWIALIIGNSCCCDPEQLQSPSPLPPPRPPHHTAPPKKLSQTLFPVLDPGKTDSWVGENSKMLQALFRCIELSNCGPNQQKVVILGSSHFRAVLWGWVSGEDIWAGSVIQALRDMGYTFLYSSDMGGTVQLYHMMPDLVKAVIVDADPTFDCFEDDANCILASTNPDGIPAWKLFSFHFWPSPGHPLGRGWTLAPEDYVLDGPPGNTYLGYSVESSCLARTFIPPDERERRAYILAKSLDYVHRTGDRAWPLHFYEDASNSTDIQFLLGADDDGSYPNLPPGMVNLGQMPQAEFLATVAKSRVLIGVGNPLTSPTPYEALCLGVPFINPIMDWDRNNPKDRTQWEAQHWMLKYLDPPYVYNVHKDDYKGFVDAINDALSHPIDRYILPGMRMPLITARLRALLEKDWKSEAAELLAQRKASDEGPLFVL